ncbi:MAG: proton-conducting membrane transporter [Lachnospiraceae bacterium]|nr:proton-conducting membrane transporter [Lachnospiraceae bacterium]
MQLFYFRPDSLSVIFIAVITVLFACSAVYSIEYMRDSLNKKRFYLSFSLTWLVLILLSCAGSLLTFYLCYEAMTLLSVPLVLHEQSHEAVIAGLKYLFYSLCGAYMALFGLFFLNRYADGLIFREGGILDPAKCAGHESLLRIVLFLMIMGFSVKAGMFPMHAWLDTAHPVAPSPASAVLSGVIVKSGVLGIIRVIFYVFGAGFFIGSWVQTVFLILSLITVFMGSMLAFREKVFKRRLAYSTVSQISYILFGIFIMDPAALKGSFLHVMAHAFIKSSLFLIAGALIHVTGLKNVGDYKGMGRREPVLFACYTLCSLALVGIPPTGGFLSKWYLAVGALSSGVSVFGYLGPVILLISALLTAGYLFPICMDAFFPGKDFKLESQRFSNLTGGSDANPDISGSCLTPEDKNTNGIKSTGKLMLMPVMILTALAVLLGMFPGGVLRFIDGLSLLSFADPGKLLSGLDRLSMFTGGMWP